MTVSANIQVVLKGELETAMQLVGITSLSQVHPGLVNTQDIDHLVCSKLDGKFGRTVPRAKI